MPVNGILGIKLGMTQIYAEDGTAIPCTVLQAGPCVVVQRRTADTDGYDAVQLGLVEFIKAQRVNKPMTGHFTKAGVAPMRFVREFRLKDSKEETKPGDRVLADSFEVGQQRPRVCRRRQAVALPRRRRDAWFDVPSRAGRHWSQFVSIACLERAAFPRADGNGSCDRKEFARGESGRGRKSAAGARSGGRPEWRLHRNPQDRQEEVARRTCP